MTTLVNRQVADMPSSTATRMKATTQVKPRWGRARFIPRSESRFFQSAVAAMALGGRQARSLGKLRLDAPVLLQEGQDLPVGTVEIGVVQDRLPFLISEKLCCLSEGSPAPMKTDCSCGSSHFFP